MLFLFNNGKAALASLFIWVESFSLHTKVTGRAVMSYTNIFPSFLIISPFIQPLCSFPPTWPHLQIYKKGGLQHLLSHPITTSRCPEVHLYTLQQREKVKTLQIYKKRSLMILYMSLLLHFLKVRWLKVQHILHINVLRWILLVCEEKKP